MGSFFTKASSLALTWFSVVDWVGNPDDRRSTSGLCIFLSNNLISWSAKKQRTVAKWSVESEYRSLAHSVTKLSWILYILRDLHIPIIHTSILWCDNVGAISLAPNSIFHACTKHIEVDYHWKCFAKNLLSDLPLQSWFKIAANTD